MAIQIDTSLTDNWLLNSMWQGVASQNPNPIYDQNLRFSLYPIYDLTKHLTPYLWPDS